MNMDQLFDKLPRDLQWEILTEFVGSHSVRNGKLIKKIVFDERHKILQEIPRIQTRWRFSLIRDVRPISFVVFSNGTKLMYTVHPEYDALLGYLFKSNEIRDCCSWRGFNRGDWVTQDLWTSIPLPFIKHSYPSYPDTDKKKRARIKDKNKNETLFVINVN